MITQSFFDNASDSPTNLSISMILGTEFWHNTG
jgi:hypothetical protein